MKEVLFGIIAILLIVGLVFFMQQQTTGDLIYKGVCSQESMPDCAGKAMSAPCQLNGQLGECIPLYKPKSCLCVG